jgi:hypothetical protein
MKFIGALTGTMSGSLGGVTAAHNRGGQYLRQRVVPTNPNSTSQMLVRSYMAAAVAYWGEMLTAAQRDDWTVYAANTPTTDSLGQELVLTGQQMFIRSAVVRARAGQAFVAAAPTTFDRGVPVSGTRGVIDLVAGEIGVAGSALSTQVEFMAELPDDGDVVMQIGKPVNPGVNFYKGPYRLVYADGVNSGVEEKIMSNGPAIEDYPFGVLTAGTRRPVRFTVAYDDGRVSVPWEAILPVVEDA